MRLLSYYEIIIFAINHVKNVVSILGSMRCLRETLFIRLHWLLTVSHTKQSVMYHTLKEVSQPASLSSGKSVIAVLKRHRSAPAALPRRQRNELFLFQFWALCCPIWNVSTMASKRPQGARDGAEKKKHKSCGETAELCSLLRDEQLKKDLKEAWSRKSPYSQGW